MKYTRKVTINSSINHLYKSKLITLQCKKVLQALNMKDAFDVMTTTFPDEGTKIPYKGEDIVYSSCIEKETNLLIDKLYKL